MKKIFLIALMLMFLIGIVRAEEIKLGPDVIVKNVEYKPYPISPGDSFTLTIKIKNENSAKTINNPRFTIQESYPFSLNEPKVRSLENLVPNQEATLDFNVKTDGNFRGTGYIRLMYQEGLSGYYISDPLKIDIRDIGQELSVSSLTTVPDKIKPGSEAEIVLTIKNVGDGVMRDIKVNLDLTQDVFTPIETSTERTIVALGLNEEIDLHFKIVVDASAEPKAYKIPLKISYEDEFGSKFDIDTTTGLKVYAEPEMINYIDETNIYKSGTKGKVVLKIVNNGASEIKFLNIKLIETDDYDIINPEEIYIGNIEPDDYETAEFNIYVKSNKDKVPLKFLFSYKDSYNNDYKKENLLYLPLYNKIKAAKYGLIQGNGKSVYIVYAIIIILAYIVFRQWRKHRDLVIALKMTLRVVAVFIKRIIKGIHPRTVKKAARKTKEFFKEP